VFLAAVTAGTLAAVGAVVTVMAMMTVCVLAVCVVAVSVMMHGQTPVGEKNNSSRYIEKHDRSLRICPDH
jgi:hypothetical protein